ncbi:MAG: GNAT family N-acetyltransferase, partial [Flavobacteriales bacterium]|nr:GNAT family N-acetyltransferase [Flavobacteriales bacterium]
MSHRIRPVKLTDIPQLKKVLDSSELFPSEYLDEMISDYLHNPQSSDFWFTCVENDTPVAIAYCVPEKLTEGTYNLLALGVSNDVQKKGIGKEMMNYIENHLKSTDGRILIIDTSSDEAQAAARNFYHKIGY